MPNAIKYNTSAETLALKKGNFYIGTGDVGKGPTSSTGYYNGITPPSGGYTIYLNKATGGPSIYTVTSNAQLITLTNQIAGASYTTVNECFNYFNGQSDKMVVQRDYEGITTNGLVFNYDAGFIPSYPQNGTTWNDTSTSSNNGSLINGPTWSLNGGGTITFDGVDDYISTTSSSSLQMSSNITLCVWFRIPQNGLTERQCLIGKLYWEYELGIYPSGGIHTYTARGNVCDGSYDEGIFVYNPLGDWIANTWYYVAWTLNGATEICYLNGSNIGTTTKGTAGTCSAGSNPVRIGVRSGPGDLQFKGDIPIAQIYNRTLSATEITQNFNAQKGRFGL
jgi:hypothetical protein